jgi:hypothetical protein
MIRKYSSGKCLPSPLSAAPVLARKSRCSCSVPTPPLTSKCSLATSPSVTPRRSFSRTARAEETPGEVHREELHCQSHPASFTHLSPRDLVIECLQSNRHRFPPDLEPPLFLIQPKCANRRRPQRRGSPHQSESWVPQPVSKLGTVGAKLYRLGLFFHIPPKPLLDGAFGMAR